MAGESDAISVKPSRIDPKNGAVGLLSGESLYAACTETKDQVLRMTLVGNAVQTQKTIRGFDTRQTLTERVLGMRRLRELEDLGHLLGIMSSPRTPGRKPSPI